MKTKQLFINAQVIIFLLFIFNLAEAALPERLNYQGHLTDNAGAPVDGAVNMVFAIYDVESGGAALWSESKSVIVNQGVFSVELGQTPSPLPPGMFETPLWIGLSVDADAEMLPRRPVTSTAYSFKAGDANTLDGISASTLDQSGHVIDTANPHGITTTQIGAADAGNLTAHTGNTSNPHSVTASQTGAASSASFTAHIIDVSAHHSRYTNSEAVVAMGKKSDINTLNHDKYTNPDAVAAIKAADGAGSNLDADKVDGLQASEIIDAAQDEVRTPISSLPITISQPGSYYLTGNLDGSAGGIDITTNNVTLDLMGFTIDGGGTVNDYGIYFTMRDNITIINGVIQGFGLAGIYQGPSPFGHFATVMEIKVVGNGTLGTSLSHSGIYLRHNSHVERCMAGDNGGSGIYVDNSSKLIDNTAYNNTGDYGIHGGTSSVLKGNTAQLNTVSVGIYGGGGSSLTGNTANSNTGVDGSSYSIFGGSGASLTNNSSYFNESSGIFGGTGANLIGNNAYSNSGTYGIYGSTSSTISGNTAIFNSSYGIYGANSTVLTGNTAYYNTGNGIYGMDNAIISGNTSNYNRGTYGIYGNTGASISGNNVRESLHWGIYAVGSNLIEKNVLYHNNTSVTNFEGGLHVGSDSKVTGNTLDNNLRNNIYVESSGSVLKDNHTTDSTYGIYFVTGINAFFNNTASGNTTDFVNSASQTTNIYLPNISF